MSKYRKKPVVVEATQWFKMGDHPEVGKTSYSDIHNEHGSLKVGDIFYTVYPNDWIITDAEGNYSIVKNDIFKATYEKVRELSKGGGQAEAPKNIRDFSLPEPNDVFDVANKEPLINQEEDFTLVTQDDLDVLFNADRTPAEKEKQTKAMDEIFAESANNEMSEEGIEALKTYRKRISTRLTEPEMELLENFPVGDKLSVDFQGKKK